MARAATQRGIGLVVLLVLGILSLPVVATFLDGQSTENWIIPVQLVLMALVGALVGYLLPGLAGPGSSSRRGAGAGAVVGVVAAVLGVLLFFVLLNGF
jgi:hypothetical protein